MRKSELRKRRDKISHFLVQGFPAHEIAKELGVSARTVERDVAYLKSEYKDWLKGLAKNGFIYKFKIALDRIEYNGYELRKLYPSTQEIAKKIQILKASDENTRLYIQLLSEIPTIESLRKSFE